MPVTSPNSSRSPSPSQHTGFLARLGLWLAACRPGFILVSVVAAGLGVAQALACGCGSDPLAAAATLVLVALAHAAANLYNDWGDSVQGSDALNTGRLGPFSGGSRVIQNGQLSAQAVREAALMLATVVVGGGLVLVVRAGPGLFLLGLLGVGLGWAYSSPRQAWMGRGLGELAVALAWWMVVLGADYVQRHAFSVLAMVAGVSLALLVTAILWAAEFPDAVADAQVGKRTAVVRLGSSLAALAYAALVLLAHGWVAVWWWTDWLPSTAWWALGSAPLSGLAALGLWRWRQQVHRLRPVLALTVAAALVHGVLLTAAFIAIARMR